jgi:LysR family transcriptional regulator, hydrogen peroxide-inducible genes activator
MISPQQIAYIIAIVDAGTISRAAKQCFVTQPTLSMQIRRAEELLGFPVFHRDSSKLELTSFGEELVPLLRQIQADYAAIERLQKEFSGTFRERIRLGIIPTVGSYMVSDCFSEWQKLIPDTQLTIEELKTEELLDALDKRKIDLGILAGPVDAAGWRVIPLFTEEILAYAPSVKKTKVSVAELNEMSPWLLSKGNCLRTQMMQFCALNDENPASWNYSGGNLDMLMRMVNEHGGYTLIPENYRSVYPAQSHGFKKITDALGHSPGRSVVAVSAYRNAQWDSMERIIRSLQLRYQSGEAKLELLSWK